MPTLQYIKNEFYKSFNNEKEILPLFAPVILGIGILFGVYYPVNSYLYLFIIISVFIIFSIIFNFILNNIPAVLENCDNLKNINSDSNNITNSSTSDDMNMKNYNNIEMNLEDNNNKINTNNNKINKVFIINLLRKSYIKILILFMLGFYVAQTGGILRTDLLVNKQFITHPYNRVSLQADVDYIDETHPIMKNMQRISLKNIKFINNNNLDFIKTAKMTCSAKIAKNIMPGDTVEVFANLLPLKTGIVPFSFNQKQYYAINNWDVAGIIFNIKQIKSNNNFNKIQYLRRVLTSNIINKLGPIEGGVASALITGDKSSIPSNIRDVFVKSGTAHILAVSGLHMTIISSILYLFLFKLFLYLQCFLLFISPKKLASFITILLTFLYLAISGFSPSANRACIMTTVCLISSALGRGVFSMRNISLSAFLILLFDSGSLFSVSFQLSFSAVTVLIAFYTKYKSKFINFININNRFFKQILIYIVGSLITTIVATVATAPISIATFNKFSMCGILGNIIAIPLISFCIVPFGILCLMGGYKFNFIINTFKLLINFLIKCLNYISNLPLTNITIKSPHINTLYCIIIGGILLCLLVTKLRHIGTLLIIIGLAKWILEKNPTTIILPKYNIVCFVKDGNFYSNFKYKAKNLVHAIQRNYGFDEAIKIQYYLNNNQYKYNTFIWNNGKRMTTSNSRHPYCPVKYNI